MKLADGLCRVCFVFFLFVLKSWLASVFIDFNSILLSSL